MDSRTGSDFDDDDEDSDISANGSEFRDNPARESAAGSEILPQSEPPFAPISRPRAASDTTVESSSAAPRTPTSSSSPARGRILRSGHRHRRPIGSSSAAAGQRIRALVRRPRCGLRLLTALRNERQLCAPEARRDPAKAPRRPGHPDQQFAPKDGDLLLHHAKRPGRCVLEFFDPDQPVPFEDGDYILRFKVDNYAFMHQSFVTVRAYLFHHTQWVYLGKDSDQMELA